MSRIRIDVTQEDIDKGVREDVQACPIWRAAQRVPGFEGCRVYGPWIMLADSREAWLPRSAMAFMGEFDDHGPEAVKPFSFTVDLPAEVEQP